jgi:hypothetical protein
VILGERYGRRRVILGERYGRRRVILGEVLYVRFPHYNIAFFSSLLSYCTVQLCRATRNILRSVVRII